MAKISARGDVEVARYESINPKTEVRTIVVVTRKRRVLVRVGAAGYTLYGKTPVWAAALGPEWRPLLREWVQERWPGAQLAQL